MALGGRAPPVGQELLLGLCGIVGEPQASLTGGVAEVALGVAGAESGQGLALGRLALAVVLLELHGAEAIAERAVEAPGPDGRELSRVADQQGLALGLLDQPQHRREHAGLGHAGLVDDEHAAGREAARVAGIGQQGVEGLRRDVGRALELVCRAAARCGAEHGDVRTRERVAEDLQRGRLARAGGADRADDPVGRQRRLLHEHSLLVGERDQGLAEGRGQGVAVGDRGACAASVEGDPERLALEVEEAPRREARRPARRRRRRRPG